MPTNYKKLFAISAEIEKQLKQACPEIQHKSGIYFLTREEQETKKKAAYIGLGVDVCRRMVSHVQGYQQRIDISLKKRGLYDKENNPNGWKLNVLYFPENLLEEKERYYIKLYKNAGFEMYNIESGGSLNKEDINERKPTKTYRDGLKQGYINAQREVAHWFNLYLEYNIKGKSTKNSEKAFDRFTKFIKGE